MGAFTNSAITEAGRVLLAEVQAGAVFTPTRLVIGSGSIPNGKTAQTMTDVVAVVKSLAINKKQRTPDGKAIFGAVYSNEDITTAFYFRELALYAKPVHLNADGSVASEGAEVLYTYGNAGDTADYMPAYSTSTVVEKQIDIVTYVGHNTQVDLTVESGIYASKAELDAVANGAVKKTGDTMTGHLEVKSDGAPNAIKLYTEPNGVGFVGTMEENGAYKLIKFVPSHISGAEKVYFVTNASGEYKDFEIIHTGNKSLITPADIGAVDKAGDTMTNNLAIAKKGSPRLVLRALDINESAIFQMDVAGRASMQSTKDDNNFNAVCVSNVDANSNDALQFRTRKNGIDTWYTIIHTGNMEALMGVAPATIE